MGEVLKLAFNSIAGPVVMLIGLGIIWYTFQFANVRIEPVLTLLIVLSPIWLPYSLFFILYPRYMEAIRLRYARSLGRTTLRIKLPQDVFKSPEAMESVFSQMFNPNKALNLIEAYVYGKFVMTYSFEIVSIGGDVRFYVNVPTKKAKNAVEAQLYAQYPGIEIEEELVDYTGAIKWDPEKYDLMSFHILKKEDEIYPIKTYIDFGLDKMPKEEEKFEPMAPLLEHLGKVKPTEQIWIHMMITSHAKQDFSIGYLHKKDTWEKKAQKKVSELLGRDKNKLAPAEFEGQPRLTTSERDTVDAIERNTSKYGYETVIKAAYIMEAGKFDGDMIKPMLGSFSQYDVIGRQRLGTEWKTDFDHKWFQDPSGKKRLKWKKRELETYQARYYWPGDVKKHTDLPKVMSVEELATIYHIPGKAVLTPSLSRVESVRRDAPSNLPI